MKQTVCGHAIELITINRFVSKSMPIRYANCCEQRQQNAMIGGRDYDIERFFAITPNSILMNKNVGTFRCAACDNISSALFMHAFLFGLKWRTSIFDGNFCAAHFFQKYYQLNECVVKFPIIYAISTSFVWIAQVNHLFSMHPSNLCEFTIHRFMRLPV